MKLRVCNRDMDYPKQVGLKVRAARNKAKLSMRQLAAIIGMKYDQIRKIEKGYVSSHITTLKAIADGLGVEVKDFV